MDITEFTQSASFKIITVSLTVIGLLLKTIQVLRKRDKINPVYITRSTLLLRDQTHNVPDLQIQYKGESTKNFSVTNIALWNAGKRSIRAQDVATANKIRIVAKNGVKIFDAVILKTTMPENKFEISFNSSENIVEINFEYLDCDNGGAIQIIHNGSNSNDIEVLGTFISHGKIISLENKTKQAIVNTLESPVKNFFISAEDKRVIFLILLIPAVIFIAMGLWSGAFWVRLVLIIHGLLYLGIAIFTRIATKTPKEFEFIEM